MRKLLLLSVLILTLTVSAHAQNITKACEKCADSLAATTAERDSLKTQLALSVEKDRLKDQMIVLITEQKDFYKSAAESFKTASSERATANETDALRIDLLRSQIADYKIELDRARREIEKLRDSRKYWMGFGAAIGAGITYGVTK